MLFRVLALVMALFVCSCIVTRQRQGGIRVETNVPDAMLYVDEELQGPAGAFRRRYVHVDEGVHRVMIEHPDHFTEFVEVEVPANMAVAVRVEMRRRPD